MKTGLLVEGGGTKCAYSAGVLDVFLDENISFDYCMGVSAGAANIASFLAKQKDRNRRFYVEHIKEPGYVGFRNLVKDGSFFGLNYIYRELSNTTGEDPLDYDTMVKNPAQMCFPATDAQTGEPRYFYKDEVHKNHYEPIMATCALPVISKPVKLNGREYFDGGVSDSIPIKKMLDDGCDRIVALMTKPRGYTMEPQGHKRVYTKWLEEEYPVIVEKLNHRHENYNRSMETLLSLQKAGKALIFWAPDDVKMSTTTRDPKTTQTLYNAGVEDGRRDRVLVKKFLGEAE